MVWREVGICQRVKKMRCATLKEKEEGEKKGGWGGVGSLGGRATKTDPPKEKRLFKNAGERKEGGGHSHKLYQNNQCALHRWKKK